MNLTNFLTALMAQANAFRQKTGVTNKLSIADMTKLLDDLSWNKTNLLKGTSDQFKKLSGSDWLAKSTASDIYTSTSGYRGGDQFTYSALVTNNSNHPVKLETWLFGGQNEGTGDLKIPAHSNEAPAHSSNVRLSVTFPITAETRWIRTYVIYTYGDGTDDEYVEVKDERLYSGTEPGIWTPNPADKVGGGS